jgi:hypothetical protein
MGMCVQKTVKILVFFAFLAFFYGCDAVDNIIPSTGTYKINAQINGIPLDECSFVGINDEIQPFFEELVLNDPDVSGFMIYLKNTAGNITGWKVIYSLESMTGQEDEKVILIKNFKNLPLMPVPANLPAGRYSMVYQIMSGKNILQRTEKPFFYIGNAGFSFNGISVNLPGVSGSYQLIPKGLNIMLEAECNFDSSLDPYVVWYVSKVKISEGYFSDGAAQLFWIAPEQSGFYSFRAELFPVKDYEDLSGYKKDVSLLVSSIPADVNVISEIIPELMHWYVFEGSLNDSIAGASDAQAVKPASGNSQKWMSSNGTYGLATGHENVFTIPKVPITVDTMGNYQTLFRFKPLNEGGLFSVLFDSSPDIFISVSIEDQKLVLTLTSSLMTVSKSYALPEQESFITAGITFSILPGFLSARLNIMDDTVIQDNFAEDIQLDAEARGAFQVLLGLVREETIPPDDNEDEQQDRLVPDFTAIWDEFALYYKPPMDVIAADLTPPVREENSESNEN